MKTYMIKKNGKVIAKRKADSAMLAFGKWCECMPFGNFNPANFAKLKTCDAETYGKIRADYSDGYEVEA